MKGPKGFILVIAVAVFGLAALDRAVEAQFAEQLTVFPLAHHGHVALLFNFTLDWDADPSGRHFGLCPKSFCSLIASKHINQLDLSMTKGRWNYEKWGNSPIPAPQGAELTVFYEPSILEETIDGLWRATTNELAGQFCASLEYMYRPVAQPTSLFSTHPIASFRMAGQTSDEEASVRRYSESSAVNASSDRVMRHSILHGETVCTENLTPWMKLLPCRSEAGLAKYLSNPSFLFNFDYLSLGVHYVPSAKGSLLQLTLMLVVDRKLPPVGASISKFQPPTNLNEFDLSRFLGVNVQQRHICPLATSSKLVVHRTEANMPETITGACFDNATQNSKSECDLLADRDRAWNLVMKWKEEQEAVNFEGFVTAHRWLVGWGQQNGKLALELHNYLSVPVSIQYRQVTPFMLRLMFHTMKMTSTQIDTHEPLNLKPQYFGAKPGQDRISSTSTEIHLVLPPRSKALITIEYDLVFLHWTEHPPDAHRGFDISAGVMLVTLNEAGKQSMQQIATQGILAPTTHADNSDPNFHHFLVYTEGIVLSLPTPDFSMPYNVITLTSTVLAIVFAFTVKTLTRRYGLLFKDGSFASDRFIVVIIRHIVNYFKKPRTNNAQQPQNTNNEKGVVSGTTASK
jgi:phosphatidylinositol glycan class T